MEESHVNGVTEHHSSEAILNSNDDEVFKGDTDASLKTTIVLKSTRDESSSNDERSGSEGDQGTEKKYKCVIKARTSVEEYEPSTEGDDRLESEKKPLKLVVRTRSTEETTPDGEDNQVTLNNDDEMSEAIRAQAKEIVQELVNKLENEHVNSKLVQEDKMENLLENVTSEETAKPETNMIVQTEHETHDQLLKGQDATNNEETVMLKPEHDEIEDKETVDIAVKPELTLVDAEKHIKKDDSLQHVEKSETETAEERIDGKEEVVEDQISSGATDENVQPVIVEDTKQHNKEVETETQEHKEQEDAITSEHEHHKEQDITVDGDVAIAVAVDSEMESSPTTEEEKEEQAEAVAVVIDAKEERTEEENVVKDEQAVVESNQPAVDSKTEDVIALTMSGESMEDKNIESRADGTPDQLEEPKDEQIELETVEANNERNEQKAENVTEKERPVSESTGEECPASANVELEEVKQDTDEKGETFAMKFESQNEEQDEEKIVTVDAEASPAAATVGQEGSKQTEEEHEETVAINFESKKEEQDKENIVTSEELSGVAVLPVAAIVKEETKQDEESRTETITTKFETNEEQADEENLVTEEQSTVEASELPVLEKVEGKVKMQDEETKSETMAMKFEVEQEQTDTENFVTEESPEVQALPIDEKYEDIKPKQDDDNKTEQTATFDENIDGVDNQTVQETNEKVEPIAMKIDPSEGPSTNDQATTVEDVPPEQSEAEETQTEPEVGSTTEVDAKIVIPTNIVKQENEPSEAEREETVQMTEEDKTEQQVISTVITGEPHAELQLTSQEESSTAFEREEEPSSPKQQYVAELFNQNTQSLQEIEEGSEEKTDDHIEEKPIVKVRLAEEPFTTEENQDDKDVIEVEEAQFDDHQVLNNEDVESGEFFTVREKFENSDSDGEVDVTIEKHSQENEVLIKDADSDDGGMADDWMAKDDVDEVVFKGLPALTIVCKEEEQAREMVSEQESSEQTEKDIEQKPQDLVISENVPEEVAFKDVNVVDKTDGQNEKEQDERELKPIIDVQASKTEDEEKKQPHTTMEVDAEVNIIELKETQVAHNVIEEKDSEITQDVREPKEEETRQEIYEPKQNTPTDHIIIADTKAITVCSDIGDLFPPSEGDVQPEKTTTQEQQREVEVSEYDIDKEVNEEMQRILAKNKVEEGNKSVAVTEEIMANEQKKKHLEDLNVFTIEENEDDIAAKLTTQESEDYEEKPPSPIEAKKVTEEGITEIFETEELRRSGIYDDTLQEEDEETPLQASGISQKDVVLANEEYLEAAEKEKRGSLRWSLLEKWEEMNQKSSEQEKTNEERTRDKETEVENSQAISTDEPQTKDSLVVVEAGQPVCAESVENQDNTTESETQSIKPEDKESKESEVQVLDVGIPVCAEQLQENIVAEEEPQKEADESTEKEAIIPAFPTRNGIDPNQPQVTEYEFKETSEPVVLETVATETTPSSITTVKTTKTTTKTRVIKARSEVQPAVTIQDDVSNEEQQDTKVIEIEPVERTPTEPAPSDTVITEQPKPHILDDQPPQRDSIKQPEQPQETKPVTQQQQEEAPMSTILFRMDGTPVIISAEPQKQPETSKKPTKQQKPKDQPPPKTPPPAKEKVPKPQTERTQETQPEMSTILFRMDGTPFVVAPPLDRSTPKTVNFNNQDSVRPVSINSVESVRGEHEGIPPLAGEEESDIDDSSLHLAKHAHPGPSRAPTVSPVKEMSPPPSPQARDDDDEEEKREGTVDSPLLDNTQPEKGQKCCIIL